MPAGTVLVKFACVQQKFIVKTTNIPHASAPTSLESSDLLEALRVIIEYILSKKAFKHKGKMRFCYLPRSRLVILNTMITNPFLNAVFATLYISGVVSVITYFEGNTPEGAGDFFLLPIAFLSMFTLSAAVMGYLFLGQPFMLYNDGKKAEAVKFFFSTVVTFAAITLVLLGIVFYVA